LSGDLAASPSGGHSERPSGGLGATRAEAVAAEIRRLILSGELKAGTRLRQVELAARFNVSTTPVREAFTVLARQGLVRHDVQRGVVVFTPTVGDVLENYEIRIALESLATEIAAKVIGTSELERLDTVIARMRAVTDPFEYLALNREFHHTIYTAAQRPRLLEIIDSLRDAFEAYVQFDATVRPDPAYFANAHEEHEAIAAALHAKAPRRARRLMESHLKRNAEHYRASVAMAATHRL
jgi:DNA-binding GntR family transcriptional regulator